MGFKHFHHLAARPPDYPYPYPDFVQVIYAAEAVEFVAAARQADYYVLESTFHPITEVQALDLKPNERLFLEAAIRIRAAH